MSDAFTIFVLIGAVFAIINIAIIMGPANPLAAFGAGCYVVVAMMAIAKDAWG